MRPNYTIFFEARKSEKFNREDVAFKTGISYKRIRNLETGKGYPANIEEILILESLYKNGILKNYFLEIIKKGGRYEYMPRRVNPSTELETYIALSTPVMYISQIATALSCSTASASKALEELRRFALDVMKLKLPPAGGIQTIVFEQCYGFSAKRYENSDDVIKYLKDKEANE